MEACEWSEEQEYQVLLFDETAAGVPDEAKEKSENKAKSEANEANFNSQRSSDKWEKRIRKETNHVDCK